MEFVGTIGSIGQVSGSVYKTKNGNYVDLPSVDGRKTTVKEKPDGTYDVHILKNGRAEHYTGLSEQELIKNFGADISRLNINVGDTNSVQQAQTRYGKNAANKFYRVV